MGLSCRKRALLRYLHGTRQQLQRLHVAIAWSNKAKAVAEVGQLLGPLSLLWVMTKLAGRLWVQRQQHVTQGTASSTG